MDNSAEIVISRSGKIYNPINLWQYGCHHYLN